MGNDFNILEYADPELGSVAGGEKTNILDENLDLEEEEGRNDENKNSKRDPVQSRSTVRPVQQRYFIFGKFLCKQLVCTNNLQNTVLKHVTQF